MDLRYEAFCQADPIFYDTAARLTKHAFPAADRPTPDGWERADHGVWVVLLPVGDELPSQGWKIHVSVRPDLAEEVIDLVWEHCVARRLGFKFLRDRSVALAHNSKYAGRAYSGKLITIYPVDQAELERALHELDDLLGGREGPYILSDLRWRSGPVYVRYGGFVERHCRTESGEIVPAIEAPDGRLVPDERRPAFRPPSWVEIPEFLEKARAELQRIPGDLPYRVVEPLHFSNGGGVYLAEDDRSGRRIVLKEARPHAGLDGEGTDAVTRLRNERDFLERVQGLDCVPELIEYRTAWEHHFLVMEYIEGETLNHEIVRKYPLIHPDPPQWEIEEYTRWALDVLDRVEAGLAALHERWVVFGDFHPNNILVRPDGRVVFIDFELASDIDAGWRATLGAPGFTAPADRRGAAADRYALGCLRLNAFMPLTALLGRDPGKAAQLTRAATQRFPLPEDFGPRVERELAAEPRGTAELPAWEGLRASMTRAILASATPDRDDRLFPGDIEQFTAGGVGIAYGAAGVLWALAEAGAGRHPEHEEWLIRHAREDDPPGLYDGLHGVAYVLDRLDRPEDARRVLEMARQAPADPLDVSLFSGLAGAGLNLQHFGHDASKITHRLIDLMDRDAHVPKPGLMFGWSGPALLLVRRYAATGDERLLDRAADALHRDLDCCTWIDDTTLQADEGWRVLPYLATGSAGIGMVIEEFLRHRPDEALARALDGIRRACAPEFVVHAGLFNGRAGLMLALGPGPVAERHAGNLAWHAVPYRGQTAFIGDQLLRLSMDLATGTSGVLLALGATLAGLPVRLPFFGTAGATTERR